jgi:hypothetical protein
MLVWIGDLPKNQWMRPISPGAALCGDTPQEIPDIPVKNRIRKG